jgi:hypothetical protein
MPSPLEILRHSSANVLVALLSCVSSATAQTPQWQRLPSLNTNTNLRLVFDTASEQPLLFECDVLGAPTRLWSFRQDAWRLRHTANHPPPRIWHAFGHDPVRQVCVLFGGSSQYTPSIGTVLGDTWEYDGIDWHYVQPALSPPAQYLGWLGHDPSLGRPLLCGGINPLGVAGAWHFDGTSWQPAPPAPFQGMRQNIASDPARRRITALIDTGRTSMVVEWDGATWQQMDRGPLPDARGRTLYFDHQLQAIVAQGGSVRGNLPMALGDRHRWDGRQWTLLPRDGSPAFNYHHIVDDPVARQRIHLGTFATGEFHIATQVLRNGQWRQMEHSAGSQDFHLVCHDTARDLFVAFDYRARKGTAWNRRHFVEHTTPPAITEFLGLAYDPLRQRMIAVGLAGAGNHRVWEHDGTQWTAGMPAPLAAVGNLVWHGRRQQILSRGGGHLYSYDGIGWSILGTAIPSVGRAMCYDSLRDRIVVVANHMSDRWRVAEWDGVAWQTIEPVHTPRQSLSILGPPSIAFDAANGRIVTFGGKVLPPATPGANHEFTNEFWLWDGQDWQQAWYQNHPQGREGATPIFDPVTQSLLLFGGSRQELNGATRFFAEAWQLSTRPAGKVEVLQPQCQGPAGMQMATDAPHPGNDSFAVTVHGVAPQQPCLVAFGFTAQAAQTVSGCWNFIPQPDALALLVSNQSGLVTTQCAIPLHTSGLEWVAQAMTLQQGQVVFSNAVRVTVGY